MTSEAAAKKSIQKLQRAIVDGLEDVKAQDIQIFNTEHLSPLFERVIVASGTSNRQTKALAASVRDAVREAGFDKPRSEGEDNGEWIIVDCGQAVVHVMQPAIRQYYRLEEIWGDKPVRLRHAAEAKAKVMQREASVATGSAAAKKGAGKVETGKPVAKPAGKSTVKSAGKPGVKSAAKPSAKSSAKPSAKPVAQPAGKVAAKTSGKPAAKRVVANAPARKSTARPAPKAAAKAAPKAAPKAAAKTAPARKAAAGKTPSKAGSTRRA